MWLIGHVYNVGVIIILGRDHLLCAIIFSLQQYNYSTPLRCRQEQQDSIDAQQLT